MCAFDRRSVCAANVISERSVDKLNAVNTCCMNLIAVSLLMSTYEQLQLAGQQFDEQNNRGYIQTASSHARQPLEQNQRNRVKRCLLYTPSTSNISS